MTAIRQDITIEQGADYDRPFLLTDDAGEPDDLTGASFVMEFRTDYDAPNALLTLSTADGTIAIDLDTAAVRPLIEYDITAAILAGKYVYDLKQRKANGRVTRRRQGVAYVSPQVTFEAPPAPSPSPAPAPSPSPSPSPSPAPGGQFDFSTPTNSMIIAAAM